MSGNIDERVKNRLIKFLMKDKIGVRKSLLILFLQAKTCTTDDAHDCLIKQGFNVNRKGVSALVGQMHSRLGILHVCLAEERHVYSLKEDRWNTVNMVLNSHLTWANSIQLSFRKERKGANVASKMPSP
jgi:hypothetical protein